MADGALPKRSHPDVALTMQDQLPGEVGLAVAIVRQVLHDANSPRADIRLDARTFVADEGLRYWGDLPGLADALDQAAHATLGLRQP